jgi:hypothetical protein
MHKYRRDPLFCEHFKRFSALPAQVLHETPSLSRFAKAFDAAHVPFLTGTEMNWNEQESLQWLVHLMLNYAADRELLPVETMDYCAL